MSPKSEVLHGTTRAAPLRKGVDSYIVNFIDKVSVCHRLFGTTEEWEDSDTLRAFYFQRAKQPKEYTKLEQIVMSDIYSRIKGEMNVKQPERKSSFMSLSCGMQDEQLTAKFLTRLLKMWS